ncbi:MAG TPA: pitrilysin family protein [Chthonomonadaceae bacterium]|nr:pitrilysin family protein [Chthonomonadaceae bacterium]
MGAGREGGRGVRFLLCAALLFPGLATQAQQTPPKTAQATTEVTRPAAGKAAPPPLGPPRPLRLPAIVEKTLPNGLRIVLLEDHSQPALWIRLAVPAGSIRDTADRVGLAAMAADLLDKGTTTRTETQIADTVDGLGARLSASAGDDYLTVSASGLSAYADTLFDLAADITLHPTFPTEELERARTRTLSSIRFSLSEPGTMADAALSRLLFGAHPYGNFSAGTLKTVPAITQQDLKQFHDTYFAPNVATLFLVGDITLDQAMAQAEKAFGAWERKEVPPPPAAPKPPPGAASSGETPHITLIDRPGAAQTEIRMGALTTGYSDPRRIVGTVATAVLGLGQFEGRLTKEIRVKRGLTYGAASFFARNKEAGSFQIMTFTKNQSTAEVVKIALDEVRKLRREPPPISELQERKDYLNGFFAVSVATAPGVLQRLVPAVLYGGGPDDLTKYSQRVQAVTPAQVQEILGDLDLNQIVLVGDAKAIEKDVKPLGSVTTIPFDSVNLLSPTLRDTPQSGAAASGSGTADAGTKGNAPTEAENAEGRARLAAAIKAHGGDAFLNLKQLALKGKGEMTPPGAPENAKVPLDAATLTAAASGKNRLELKTALGDIIFASPGSGQPAWISIAGQVQDAPTGTLGLGDPMEQLRRAAQDSAAVRALPDTEDGKPAASTDGRPLKGFSITDAQGKVNRVYIDAETHLVRRVVTQDDTVLLLSDYHNTDGVPLPGTLAVVRDGKEILHLIFDTFEINKPVEDALFARPK